MKNEKVSYYNKEQLCKDLKLIASRFGTRESVGFYTQGSYIKGRIQIVDPYVVEPILFDGKNMIDLHFLPIDSYIGRTILQTAMKAEEYSEEYL
jgi:hypothetical protein